HGRRPACGWGWGCFVGRAAERDDRAAHSVRQFSGCRRFPGPFLGEQTMSRLLWPGFFLVAFGFSLPARGAPAPALPEDKPLRVLLAAGGPTRDYQFVRKLLAREAENKRAELCVYLQSRPDRSRDLPPERVLTQFPDRLEDLKDGAADQRFANLAAYDLI